MSEQPPQTNPVSNGSEHIPVDPTSLVTEHGYTPDYPVYPGEEGRVLSPDQAHEMANASKEQEESVVSSKNAAKAYMEMAAKAPTNQDEAEFLRKATIKANNAITSRDWADEAAAKAGRRYIDNQKTATQIQDTIDKIK